jgi:interferon gamma inducible protein 47
MVRTFIIFFVALVFITDATNYERDTDLRKMTIERFQIYIKGLDTKNLPIDVQTRLEDPFNSPLNIAVTGDLGVGKSTLINTLRGLSAGDLNVASVGVVETTHKILKYIHPNDALFIYWDLPGCGTLAYSRDSYLATVNFDRYDFFLIVSANRFTENDAWLAKEIQKRGKQFFYIRNKINLDLENEERDHPERNPSEVLDEIRNDCMKNLIDGNQQHEVPMYLISALLSDNDKWDFAKLINDSIRENLKLKQELLISQLRLFSQSEIKRKAELMRSRIFLCSLIGAFIPLISLPSIIILVHVLLIQHASN